jgi:hypothetical protein
MTGTPAARASATMPAVPVPPRERDHEIRTPAEHLLIADRASGRTVLPPIGQADHSQAKAIGAGASSPFSARASELSLQTKAKSFFALLNNVVA